MSVISGMDVEVPIEIQSLLEHDEKVLHSFEEASVTGKVGGAESIYVTNKRVFKLKPKTLGLGRIVSDYRYVNMANVYMKKGITRSNLYIHMRFLSKDVEIEHIPKETTMKIVKTIQAGMEGKLETKEQVPTKPETNVTSNSDDIIDQIRKRSELKKEGILTEEKF
jgi:hypothetical protein